MTTLTILTTVICILWGANRSENYEAKKENLELKAKIEKLEERK